MTRIHLFFTAAVLAVALFACKVDPKIAPTLSNLREIIPPGFPDPAYTFSTNVLTSERFALGRALFYDPALSINDTVSCASCHQNYVAFANDDHIRSHGVKGQFGKRNTPALFNLAWHPYFMADGAAANIEVQPVLPICNKVEMGNNMVDLVQKLQAMAKYQALFKSAYGSDTVTTVRLLRSLAQFMGLMYSYNSKYDQYKRGENNVSFTAQELHGYQLFIDNCSSCHKEPLFTDFKFRSNGLSVDPLLQDSGRAHVTAQTPGLYSPGDVYKFKTPSLRNIEKTGPYMHDGRFRNLDSCLNHYTSLVNPNGIVNKVNLDPLLQNGLTLSSQDKQDIIAFLKTLTDNTFINDQRFANPNVVH